MGLFGNNRKAQKAAAVAATRATETFSDDYVPPIPEVSSGYYFEDMNEFLIFVKNYANKDSSTGNVSWLSGPNYAEECRKGYQLFEQGNFTKCIEAYKNALKLNPIGLTARFEIAEANMQLRNYAQARNTLFEMRNFLLDNPNIARFYRRLGYIEIEKKNYQAAAACYQYSRQFENHPSIPQELEYIKHFGGAGALAGNPETVLKSNGIPIITSIEK